MLISDMLVINKLKIVLMKMHSSVGLEENFSTERSAFCTHHGLIFINGMGAHVKKTVSSRKDLRPHTSDSAPISGALRKDNRPWKGERRRGQGNKRMPEEPVTACPPHPSADCFKAIHLRRSFKE